MPKPKARFTVLTLGVDNMRRAIAFYEALGFERKMKATGEAVAFFATGGSVLALFPWNELAEDAADESIFRKSGHRFSEENATKQEIPYPRPAVFRGVTLAWNCNSRAEVDAVMGHALSCGGELRRRAGETDYGGYRGYFADPDGHLWEVVVAPGIVVDANGLLSLED
jgi:catechol 2,3-dioxygenase-like lactoylglutathione lyase family enzyme